MDWFERLTGFAERSHADTQARLAVQGDELVSLVSGQRHGIGHFTLPSLDDLRMQTAALPLAGEPSRLSIVQADVSRLHLEPAYEGALFQVASQFNMLEMPGPEVTPEMGVTNYAYDRTQGPACAMAAGAATIWRNCFVPLDVQRGQSEEQQLDGLADLGAALAAALQLPLSALWQMRNGYALARADGLKAIARHLRGLDVEQTDRLRGLLRLGLHADVEVTLADVPPRPRVSQIFCSALPVAYGRHPAAQWEALGRLVLEAAYEATLRAGVLNRARGRSAVVVLTLLGGGAFGNPLPWILDAAERALRTVRGAGLDIRLVSYHAVPRDLHTWVQTQAQAA